MKAVALLTAVTLAAKQIVAIRVVYQTTVAMPAVEALIILLHVHKHGTPHAVLLAGKR